MSPNQEVYSEAALEKAIEDFKQEQLSPEQIEALRSPRTMETFWRELFHRLTSSSGNVYEAKLLKSNYGKVPYCFMHTNAPREEIVSVLDGLVFDFYQEDNTTQYMKKVRIIPLLDGSFIVEYKPN